MEMQNTGDYHGIKVGIIIFISSLQLSPATFVTCYFFPYCVNVKVLLQAILGKNLPVVYETNLSSDKSLLLGIFKIQLKHFYLNPHLVIR